MPTLIVRTHSVVAFLSRPVVRLGSRKACSVRMTSFSTTGTSRNGDPNSIRKRGIAICEGPIEGVGAKKSRPGDRSSSEPSRANKALPGDTTGQGHTVELIPGVNNTIRARIVGVISQELSLSEDRVCAAVQLLDDGNTLPFIARYRKEATGCLDEIQLRQVAARMEALDALEARRKTIIHALQEQGIYSGKLRAEVEAATTGQRLEDLYLPHRPKRSTRSTSAKDKGLAPLAQLLLSPTSGLPPAVIAKEFLSGEVPSPEMALAGARDILAEQAAELPLIRELARSMLRRQGLLTTTRRPIATGKVADGKKQKRSTCGNDGDYIQYHDFRRAVSQLQPHQTLAINRGEAAGEISVSLEWDVPAVCAAAARVLADTAAEARGRPLPGTHQEEVKAAAQDGIKRLLKPAIERELRSELTAAAQAKAVSVFGKNLSSLLLQAPLPGKIVLGIDPAYRTGCKLAVVDQTGRVLETGTVFPHAPAPGEKRHRAHPEMASLMRRHNVQVVAIGNGTASRETEEFVALVCKELQAAGLEVGWVVVNEAGASVYSASELASKELQGMDVSLRGAVSIARRLQDPLSELVKIEPHHIGVGLYQHDLKEKRLAQELDAVVEMAVNSVGVDVNVASPALLTRVAGLGPALAKRMVEHRDQSGAYKDRASLTRVRGLGKKAFEQCAGFLRISGGNCALDNTPIHPESYWVVERLVERYARTAKGGGTAITPEVLSTMGPKIKELERCLSSLSKELSVGEPTLQDILSALKAPGRDVRGLPSEGLVRRGARSISELRQGVEISGVVRNVVAFGAFVDIGVGRDALLHKSGMRAPGGGLVADPHSVVAVGNEVMVRVTEIDEGRGRLSVAMLQDGPM